MTKTEQKLLAALENSFTGIAGYQGSREAKAARELEAKGLVRRTFCDGTVIKRRRDGSVERQYHPQGYISNV